MFPSTTPTLDADVAAMAKLKATLRRAARSASARTSPRTPIDAMERAPIVDGMFVGEPEEGVLASPRCESLEGLSSVPSADVPHATDGSSRIARTASSRAS